MNNLFPTMKPEGKAGVAKAKKSAEGLKSPLRQDHPSNAGLRAGSKYSMQ